MKESGLQDLGQNVKALFLFLTIRRELEFSFFVFSRVGYRFLFYEGDGERDCRNITLRYQRRREATARFRRGGEISTSRRRREATTRFRRDGDEQAKKLRRVSFSIFSLLMFALDFRVFVRFCLKFFFRKLFFLGG